MNNFTDLDYKFNNISQCLHIKNNNSRCNRLLYNSEFYCWQHIKSYRIKDILEFISVNKIHFILDNLNNFTSNDIFLF